METISKFTKTIAALIIAAVPFAFIAGFVNLVACGGSGAPSEVEIASITPVNAAMASDEYTSGYTSGVQAPTYHRHKIPEVTFPETHAGLSPEFLKEQEKRMKAYREMIERLEKPRKNIQSIDLKRFVPPTSNPHINGDDVLLQNAVTTEENSTVPDASQTITTNDSVQ